MSTSTRLVPDRRTRKRQATRQAISDAATRLFLEQGFDRVTVDQIAEAADVGRMTVFNHFPRKEDMFFDREGEIRGTMSAAISGRASRTSPVAALRLLAHRLVGERNPLIPLSEETLSFVATALASEALKARVRQLCSEFTQDLAAMLAVSVGREAGDPDGHLAASLMVATWCVAFAEGHKIAARSGETGAAEATFLRLIDQGSKAVEAALAGTPYVDGVL
ncbi:TetR/AcrR family transcriptional regulator [Methylobacterium sp. GC_Met_2]|uniref:TetR/AcrR family transcriptional regulator n=1 Tax=Methylobacterium sp. GC_Met_2 TaxID=2937376 RepID=UPI00226B3E3A|nr:TetR/AcrR family transcriptional regulator [Methylobacterium sp. GC_Met_2]